MQNRFSRCFAFLISLSLFFVLIAGNAAPDAVKDDVSSRPFAFRISRYAMSEPAEIVSPKNSTHDVPHMGNAGFCPYCGDVPLSAVYAVCIIAVAPQACLLSIRYIIRYIHDQCGYKNRPLHHINIRNLYDGGMIYDKVCAFRNMRNSTYRNDSTGCLCILWRGKARKQG